MPTGKDETVAVRPPGVAWVVAQVAHPERVSHCRRAHWQAGMTGIGLLNGIGGQETDGIDSKLLQLGVNGDL